MYRLLFQFFFSRLDPERAHSLAFAFIRILGVPLIGGFARAFTRPPRDISVETLGLRFTSPFGLAAGFDKNATAIRGLGNLGFGHVEVGTLTALAQPGNPRPRSFRLVADRALVNRMGFNNHGSESAVPRLVRHRRRSHGSVVGVNIGKSRVADIDDATEDYVTSTRLLAPLADYLAVNVSSPNTPGLRGLQDVELLRPLLAAVKSEAAGTPVLVKIAPDLSDQAIIDVCGLVAELALDGIIATNTTLSRDGLVTDPSVVDAAGTGGLSGAPLARRSREVLAVVRSHLAEGVCVISVGGVETAHDVVERLEAGATLVQGYTGFIYAGPLWVRHINRGIAKITKPGTGRA
ncbi:MAG: quinone-dependent dihydroorotate dehydrogenase [Terrimesophilobacter sp.]